MGTTTRRRFLASLGLTGAAAALNLGAAPGTRRLTGSLGLTGPAPIAPLAEVAAELLRTVTTDTFRGLAAWVVPGPDPYSLAQGVRDAAPGGVAARADRFLQEGLDGLLPFPDEVVAPLVEAISRGWRETTGEPAPETGSVDRDLDDLLETLTANDASVPVSGAVALLLNLTATQVAPADALAGPFPAAPFANLTWDDKTEVMRRIEEDQRSIAAALDEQVDEPTRAAVSGLLDFAGGAIVHFTAFGAYSEYHAFDPETGEATERPIGWDLTGFAPGRRTPADGWDEFKGYHRGLRTFAPTSSR